LVLILAACTPAPTPTPVKAPTAAPTAALPAATRPAAKPTVAAAAPTAAPAKPAAEAGDPVAGKSVFDSNCTSCHPGGQRGAGPSLVGALGRLGEARVINQIRNGGGNMPASSISNVRLADLIAYLGSLK